MNNKILVPNVHRGRFSLHVSVHRGRFSLHACG